MLQKYTNHSLQFSQFSHAYFSLLLQNGHCATLWTRPHTHPSSNRFCTWSSPSSSMFLNLSLRPYPVLNFTFNVDLHPLVHAGTFFNPIPSFFIPHTSGPVFSPLFGLVVSAIPSSAQAHDISRLYRLVSWFVGCVDCRRSAHAQAASIESWTRMAADNPPNGELRNSPFSSTLYK